MNNKLTCCCGARAQFYEGEERYIFEDGHLDEHGHRYITQQQTREWLDRHSECPAFEFAQINEVQPTIQ